MARFGTHLVATLVVMLALDALWLGLVAVREYRTALGDLLLPSFRALPAVLFYVVYAAALVGLAEFAVGPAGPVAGIAWRAALFGLAAYATYDLTNLATLRPWTVRLAVTDLVWGTVLSTVAASLGTIAARAVLRASGLS